MDLLNVPVLLHVLGYGIYIEDISYGFAECPGSFACVGVCYAH